MTAPSRTPRSRVKYPTTTSALGRTSSRRRGAGRGGRRRGGPGPGWSRAPTPSRRPRSSTDIAGRGRARGGPGARGGGGNASGRGWGRRSPRSPSAAPNWDVRRRPGAPGRRAPGKWCYARTSGDEGGPCEELSLVRRALRHGRALLPAGRHPARRARATPRSPPSERDPYLGIELPGQIRLDHLIGIGSMGRVTAPSRAGIERDVAVKVLHRELSGNAELRRASTARPRWRAASCTPTWSRC